MNNIRALRKQRGLTLAELAAKINTTEASVSRYEREDERLTLPLLRRIADALGTNVATLVAGNYDVDFEAGLAEDQPRLQRAEEIYEIDSKPSHDDSFPPGLVAIEEIDVRAGMGGGGEVDAIVQTTELGYTVSKDAVKQTWGVPESYLREMGISPAGAFMFRVQGDSMTKPDGTGIHSGDLVIADTHDRRPSPPGIFALWDGFGCIVKRLEFIMGSEPPRLMIASDNPNHRTFERNLDEVNIVGRLSWVARRL
jgi:transcriptional regulator with XRE-family HTH domain